MYVQYPVGAVSSNAVFTAPGTAGAPSSYTPPLAGAVGSGYLPPMQQMAPPQYARGGQQFGGGLTQPLPVFTSPRDPANAMVPGPGNGPPGQFAHHNYSGGQYPAFDGLFPGVPAPQGKMEAFVPQPQDFRNVPPPAVLPHQQQQLPCAGPGSCPGACGNGCSGGGSAAPQASQTRWPPPPQASGGAPLLAPQHQAQSGHGPPAGSPPGQLGQPGMPPVGNVEDPDDDPNRLPTFVKVRGLPPDNDPRITRRPKAKKRAPGVCCA